MRVLLTGHQGYLGTVMAPILATAGHEVTGLDSGLFADCVLGSLDTPGLGATVEPDYAAMAPMPRAAWPPA